jgi:hypothetical protein
MAETPILLQYANGAAETLTADDIAFLTQEGVAWVAFPFAVVSATSSTVTVDPSDAVAAIEDILAGGVGGNLVYRVEISQDWPSTLPNPKHPLHEELLIPQIRTEFEAGYVQSRRRGTRERRKWALEWDVLTNAQRITLQSFFIARQGSTFAWTHPVTLVSYTVRFSDDAVKMSFNVNQRWSATVVIEEA